MIEIAEITGYAAIPRTTEFAAQLEADEFTLIPAAMARIGIPELRTPILLSTEVLAGNIARLREALRVGEPDNADLERHLISYVAYRDAVIFWRDAHPSVRDPSLAGEP